jgi:hypothetical protein
MNKTYSAIREKYSWPKVKQEIENYVRRCCQVNKVLGPQGKNANESHYYCNSTL